MGAGRLPRTTLSTRSPVCDRQPITSGILTNLARWPLTRSVIFPFIGPARVIFPEYLPESPPRAGAVAGGSARIAHTASAAHAVHGIPRLIASPSGRPLFRVCHRLRLGSSEGDGHDIAAGRPLVVGEQHRDRNA